MVKGIQEVLEAEKKAETAIKKADKRKEEILAAAKNSGLNILSGKTKEIDKLQEEIISKKRKELDKKKVDIKAEGDTEVTELEKQTQGNVAKARDFIIKEFENRIK